MSFLSKVKAKYLVIAANRYWHGSPKDHGNILKVLPYEYEEGDGHVGVHDFGGVFLAEEKTDHIHGGENFWYFIDLKDSEILSLNDLYHRHYKDPKVKEVLERLLPDMNIDDSDEVTREKEENNDTKSNAEFIWDEICGRSTRRNRYRSSTERLHHLLGSDGCRDGEWQLQTIQGQIAEALGFKAVELEDERGTAYLLVGPNEMQKEDTN